MEHDPTFRAVLLVGFAVLAPVALFYRVRSQLTGEKLDRRQEGWFIFLTLRPIGVAGMVGVIVYLIDPRRMAWAAFPLPLWLRWTGAGLGVITGGLIVWTFHNLGKNLTDTVVTRREHTLVTAGPYRWVQHPFYAAAALAVVANSLATANAFVLVTGVIAVALIVIRTRREEQHLVARFGDEYRSYMARTGRFVPRLTARSDGVAL